MIDCTYIDTHMRILASTINYLVIFLLAATLVGCELVGGIFKLGIWTGVIAFLLIVGTVVYAIWKVFFRRS